jgi:uncharacterized protein (DUF885 family)
MTSSFAEAQAAFFTDFFRHYPVHATEAGNHEHDDRWPDLTDAGSAERVAWLTEARAGLEGLDGLSRGEEIDRRVLIATIDELVFDEDLDELSWSPIVYSYLIGGGLFGLVAREFAPVEQRLASAAGRMEGIPAALEAARDNLLSGRGRAVATFHTEKAIQTMPGAADLCRTAAQMAADVDPDLRARVEAAAESAVEAIDAFVTWLRDDLAPTADGDFRLGRELYERKFRHRLKATIGVEELEARAAAAYDEVRAEMARLARELWPEWIGDEEPMPDDPDAVTRRVLDAIGRDHPKADELLDYCRAEHERILAFVRERDLIGLPDDPLQIIWTPPFLRAFGGAMLIPPGPLDKGLDSFFAITPPREDWTDEQVESMLREHNSRALRILTIHEATPGHYLQLAWSNRCDSLARSVFGSGVFAEGWAVYVTQVMMDVGYGVDDPAFMLAHWKYYLRATTNTLMDIRIHAGSMTEDEAMTMMVDGGFQERAEASEKWNRARLSSTQLCSYFLGGAEMTELEREERRRKGDAFAWRPFLESVVSHGTPPMPVIRDILYGD